MLKVLYVFSGRKRKNSVGGHLRRLAKMQGITMEVIELDIQRSRKDDFSLPPVQKRWLQRISNGEFFAVLVTPPCSTFTRAVWANDQGPFPVRSAMHMRGFPWNGTGRWAKAELGNILADFSFEAMKRQHAVPQHLGFMEQPEDLGRTANPRIPGHRPASMWQFPQFQQCLQQGMRTVVFSQLDFGSPSVKPTRLLLAYDGEIHPSMLEGPPELDADGWYVGPLPRRQGAPLIGRTAEGFKTTGSAAWPSELSLWTAEVIIAAYKQYSGPGGSNGRKRLLPDKEDDDVKKRKLDVDEEAVQVDPMAPLVVGGHGPPRCCWWKGESKPFHDGGGLASPGRWPFRKRKYPGGEKWRTLRRRLKEEAIEAAGGVAGLEKEFFRMTRGGDAFKLVRDANFLQKLRQVMVDCLGLHESALEVPPGQPFFLKLIRCVLDEAEDGDTRFLERACTGLPLGILEKLPRTPNMYEQQVKWALDNDPNAVWSLAKGNYVSAVQHVQHLRSHLEAEVEMGLMEKMSSAEFEGRFGENRAIAALAVLVEDEVSGKKRVIHDGTHGVGVNNRIRCLDKVRMPGPREKREIMEELSLEKEVVMALVGDFEKAHRRFLYQERERGFLGCKVEDDEDLVYVNRVGTFGVGSTPYWWSRISAALMRLTHALLGEEFWVELLLYADDLEVIAPGRSGRLGAVLSFCIMAAVGAPFKWSKQRGGWETEWVGIHTDYKKMEMGLSERRAEWLCRWLISLVDRKEVGDQEFAAGLGRLSFAALALPWERPLLGPLFSWSSAIRGSKGLLRIPWVVLVVAKWIRRKMSTGLRMEKVVRPTNLHRKTFKVWTDAKATDEAAWIGGWLQEDDDPKKCQWFSERVESWMAPWLGVRGGNPKRVIAALELLASMVAIKIWSKRLGGDFQVRTEAFTDNAGNEYIVKRGMSTKFPITLLIIELNEVLRTEGITATLSWIRRDENQLADDLTNEEFSKFDMEMRVRVTRDNLEWLVLEELLPESNELYTEIQKFKEEKQKKRKADVEMNKRKKKQKYFGRWNS